MLTYCFPVWPAVPYLHITGPLASGKSRLLEVVSRLAWRSTLASSMTAGVLFRTLHERGGTFLLDEAERLGGKSGQMSEMETVLLAGYKAGSRVSRLQTIGGGYQPVYFDVFGPKALGSIGDLPPALASRCIRVRLLRTSGDRPQVRNRLDGNSYGWQALRDDLHALALTHAGKIMQVAAGATMMITGMSGRDGELWRPLLDLATTFHRDNADEPGRSVREYADRLITEGVEDTSPDPDKILVSLLADAVAGRQADLTSKDLLGRAREEDGVTFARWTPHRVAGTLKRYGMLTRKTGRGRRSYRDVTLDQIRRAAKAYGFSTLLDAPDASSATHATPSPTSPPPMTA